MTIEHNIVQERAGGDPAAKQYLDTVRDREKLRIHNERERTREERDREKILMPVIP